MSQTSIAAALGCCRRSPLSWAICEACHCGVTGKPAFAIAAFIAASCAPVSGASGGRGSPMGGPMRFWYALKAATPTLVSRNAAIRRLNE